eukprot:1399856-Prymnesium_polylepis.1
MGRESGLHGFQVIQEHDLSAPYGESRGKVRVATHEEIDTPRPEPRAATVLRGASETRWWEPRQLSQHE